MDFLIGFDGRIGRGKWWLGQLVNLFILVALAFALILSGSSGNFEEELSSFSGQQWLVLIIGLLAATSVNASVCVKRYHDRGKSGVWFFLCFIPYIGAIWQLVELGFFRGEAGANKYGGEPGSGSSFGSDFGAGSNYASYDDIDAKIAAMQPRAGFSDESRSRAAPAVQPNTSPVQRNPGFGRRVRF
jgi:uncharacterized membrane protein YhaH (DUF805 family)